MLPPIIIEHIKKRDDEERRRRDQQPFVQLPVPQPARHPRPSRTEEEPERGVVIIDLG
jgi:hypothetical protein